eukprot:TRINITY_DN9941_c0_g4_i1.p1 TRINITY_DN9941_c0_g4~~TRINITY_DN9941_c0_g4_i1.p1  ORF type:complete len:107 (+),score=17.33 TRINITY_DN9941_c0_g4_i1:1-321(+)
MKNVEEQYIKKYLSIADNHKKAQNFQNAIEVYDKVLNVDPNVTDAWVGKAEACEELERFDEALHCFAMARALGSGRERRVSTTTIVLVPLRKKAMSFLKKDIYKLT